MTDESTKTKEKADISDASLQMDSGEKNYMPLSFRDAIVGSTATVVVADQQQNISHKLSELRDSLIRQELEETFHASPTNYKEISSEMRNNPEMQPSNQVSEPEAFGRIVEQELSKAR